MQSLVPTHPALVPCSENIQTQGIRFRLYTNERFKREKLLAEATVLFATVNLEEDMCKLVTLERAYVSRSLLSDRLHAVL